MRWCASQSCPNNIKLVANDDCVFLAYLFFTTQISEMPEIEISMTTSARECVILIFKHNWENVWK